MIKEWGDLYMNDIFYVLQNQTFIDLCIYQFGYEIGRAHV